MLPELLILTFAVVLFFYWFRYNCAAILRANGSPDLALQVAEANHLRFPEVEDVLNGGAAPEIDALNEGLGRDYQVLTSLLRYTSGFRAGSFTVEQRILILDFKLMQCCYALTRRHAHALARRSLRERSRILAYFAHAMAKRCAALSRA